MGPLVTATLGIASLEKASMVKASVEMAVASRQRLAIALNLVDHLGHHQ